MPPLWNFLWMIGYGVAAAIIMSLALGVCIKVWSWLTPINDWEEIRKGNMAAAVVMAAVIVGFAIVVASAIFPR